ncbi:MAG: hypothetical protein ACOCW6_06345 [Spirochaetota bacterium]
MRRHSFSGAPAFVLLIALLSTVLIGSLDAQWLGVDWSAQSRHDYELVEVDDAPEIQSLDTLFLSLTAVQQTSGPALRYHLSGGIGYSPQTGRISLDEGREVVVYPGPLGVEALWDPEGRGGRWISGRLGRIEVTDGTGILFENPRGLYPTQLLDGAGAAVRYPGWFGSLEVGYLGLLDKDLNHIRLSPEDVVDAADGDTYFGPKRLLSVLNLQAGSLLWRQDGGLIAVLQEDLGGSSQDVSSYYLGPVVRGPLTAGFSHVGGVVVAYTRASQDDDSGVSLLAFWDLNYTVPIEQLNEAWIAVRYGSSDGSSLVRFPTLGGPAVGSVLRHPLSDVVSFEIGTDAVYPIPPNGAVIVPSLSTALLFVPSGDAGGSDAIEPSGTFGGFEVEVGADYRLQEDLSVAASAAWSFLDGAVRPAFRLLGRIAL